MIKLCLVYCTSVLPHISRLYYLCINRKMPKTIKKRIKVIKKKFSSKSKVAPHVEKYIFQRAEATGSSSAEEIRSPGVIRNTPSHKLWREAMGMYEPIWYLDISGLAVQSLNCNRPLQSVYCVFLDFMFIATLFHFQNIGVAFISMSPIKSVVDLRFEICLLCQNLFAGILTSMEVHNFMDKYILFWYLHYPSLYIMSNHVPASTSRIVIYLIAAVSSCTINIWNCFASSYNTAEIAQYLTFLCSTL